ncbi:hypothetical protein H4R18_004931 [Coemansia javaensis]|uniref:Uncharacterized protein n=1 Tax=Coemansia javaensis TaxID=2761396 RepID=A0A9W8LE42_9FUNG|nr:hypothetical protein H4R18_004931 [Coemansia javaensis]
MDLDSTDDGSGGHPSRAAPLRTPATSAADRVRAGPFTPPRSTNTTPHRLPPTTTAASLHDSGRASDSAAPESPGEHRVRRAAYDYDDDDDDDNDVAMLFDVEGDETDKIEHKDFFDSFGNGWAVPAAV